MKAIMKTKRGSKEFDININITPKPPNCFECPLFYMPHPEDEDGPHMHWESFIRDCDNYGVALNRPDNCPLDASS